MSTETLGPCPLCGGEASVTVVGTIHCRNHKCGMSGFFDREDWNRLSALADQNKRRGEALERLKREFIHRNEGGSPMFHESNATIIGWCEEAIRL